MALAADLRRAPDRQWATAAVVGGIHLYQSTLSVLYARMGLRCRFTLSCSQYGETCIKRFGAMHGGWLAMKRVLKCGPWTPMGTNDPPPAGA